MIVTATDIPDVQIIEPRVFSDERGYFYESFNERIWRNETGMTARFVQDNHSRSQKNTLRGLHYQLNNAQGKLVRVVNGAVFDVAVDIRRGSPDFGKWVGVTLTAENYRQLWVPEGFAHGFLVLSEYADFLYKTTNFYSAKDERCISWDDPDVAIQWPIDGNPLLSEKDRLGLLLSDAECFP